MTQKITHIIEKDRHGHVKHDVPITVPITSEEGDSELLAMSQKGASDIAAATRDKITDLVVVDRDGTSHSKTHTDPDTGEKVAVLQADEIGKIDGVKVNGEELPVDDNGKVDISIPTTVHELDPDDAYATKADAQAMVNEAKVTGATLNYQEDGGSPSATVNFSEGSLGFTLKNMKMKFSDLSPEEIAAITGPQGIPGDNCIPLEGESPLAQVLSKASDKAITPKAVAEEIYSVYEEFNLTSYEEVNSYINASGQWKSSSTEVDTCIFIPIQSQWKRLKVEAIKNESDEEETYHIEFMATNAVTGTPSFVTVPARMWRNSSNEDDYIEIPTEANYIYVRAKNSTRGHKSFPAYLGHADGIASMNESIRKYADGKVEGLKTDAEFKKSLVGYGFKNVALDDYSPIANYINADGIWKNSASISNASSCKLIPVVQGEIYKISSNPNLSSSFNGVYAVFLKTNAHDNNTTPSWAGGVTEAPIWDFVDKIVTAPSDANYLYVRYGMSGNVIEPIVQRMVTLREQLSVTGESMADVEGDNEKARVEQAIHISNSKKALGLVHYSDIHGDNYSSAYMLDAIRRLEGSIDDVIATGDVVHYYADGTTTYPQGADWWQNSGLAEKSLFVLGNHDAATTATTEYDVKEDSAAWDGKGQEWSFDNYFAEYAEELGITLPEGYDDSTSPYYKACYWHKDYADKGIRLIGLDVMHRFDGELVNNNGVWSIESQGVKHLTDEQEQWLIARLNETLTGSGDDAEGFSVIVCAHYPLDDLSASSDGGIVLDHKTNDIVNWHYANAKTITNEKKFNIRNRVGTKESYTKGTVNNVGNILQAFIQNGGKMVAWLCGHFHSDLMFYPNNYPNILNIAVTQTGWLRGGAESNKASKSYSHLSANFIAVDTDNNLIKIVRLGLKTNRLFAPLNVICYDYVNKKVINEW